MSGFNRKTGNATGVTPVIARFSLRPGVHAKKTVLAAHRRKQGLRRNLPANPFPLLLWNPLRISNRPAYRARTERGVPRSLLFRRPWKSEGNLFACMVMAMWCQIRARRQTWSVPGCWITIIRFCAKWDFGGNPVSHDSSVQVWGWESWRSQICGGY